MSGSRRQQAVVAGAACLALALGACGGEEAELEPTTTATAPDAGPAEPAEPAAGGGGDQPGEGLGGAAPEPAGDGATEPDPLAVLRREAVRTVERYVAALDRRDGEAVCALLAPGAIEPVELPRERGDCAASLAASIGYRDPRGLPVWRSARTAGVRVVELDQRSAQVVATTITEFADRDEPSIEDDVVYLAREGGAWLVAKPSSTLYRAVGVADVPPSVLAPP